MNRCESIHDAIEAGFNKIIFIIRHDIEEDFADQMLKDGVTYTVLQTDDKWFGVTYKEDKPLVMESIRKLIEAGEYKEELY